MNWIDSLYRTYDTVPASQIGVIDKDTKTPLLPICHSTNKAQVEIIIDGTGNFLTAHIVDETDATTIIPCTESSSSRAGKKPANHPLCDKLQYIAGDFIRYGGEVTSGFTENPAEPFELYVKMLSDWCASKYAHPMAQTILSYVLKKEVVHDLVNEKVLVIGDDGKLLRKWESPEPAPRIFKLFQNEAWQADAFIRWIVQVPGVKESKSWKESSLWNSWADYYTSTKSSRGLCFVTAKECSLADQHPAKIRNAGDKAKLISSNDGQGYTFRGRFTEAEQVCGVSFEVSQKAHSTLSWLIARQGYRDGDLAVVAWAVSKNGTDVPDPMADTFEWMKESEAETMDVGQTLAIRLRNKIAGYTQQLGPTDRIIVIGLDSATTGRMAIPYFRELTGSDYLERIENWHESCSWHQNFGKDKRFVGAPSPRDIAEVCYGKRLDEKLRKATVQRILPCIVDGRKLPRDLMESTVRRATNRVGLDPWEWEKTLGIACALYRKFYEERRYDMALETKRNSRDYLYGRLLAVADLMEQKALNQAGESRPTNATRMMQRFADRPCSTWRNLSLNLNPYKTRLGRGAKWYMSLMDEIMNIFDPLDFNSDKPLGGEFLLGYHVQRAEMYKGKPENSEESGEE